MLILAINCGSTSTKIALFEDRKERAVRSMALTREELEQIRTFDDDVVLRRRSVQDFLDEQNITAGDLACVVARGGVPGPVRSGAYVINRNLMDALKEYGEVNGGINHGNVSGVLANWLAEKAGIPAYIYDAVSVDELADLARYSGIDGHPRYSRTHTLNTRAMAIEAANDLGKDYREMNIITAHLGGGNSVNIYEHGILSDLVTSEEGGFSAERCGGLPGELILELVKSEGFDKVSGYFHGKGGLVSYCGTNSAKDIEENADAGDAGAAKVLEAMAYQTAKCIGSMAPVVKGKVDLIVLTGGMLYSQRIAKGISDRVAYLAPVVVKPGEREMDALVNGAYRVMTGQEKAHEM